MKDAKRWLPGALISILLIAAILYFVDLRAMVNAIRHANYTLLGIGTVLGFVWIAIRAIVWRTLLRNPGGMIGVAILTIAIALALFGPLLFPTSPWRMVQRPFLPPLTISGLPLGTDALGRDVMAGIIYGARVSLLVGLISTLASLAIGIPLGAVAGYFGGKIDDALMRFTEFFQTVPSFALAIVLVAIMQPSIVSIVAAIARIASMSSRCSSPINRTRCSATPAWLPIAASSSRSTSLNRPAPLRLSTYSAPRI